MELRFDVAKGLEVHVKLGTTIEKMLNQDISQQATVVGKMEMNFKKTPLLMNGKEVFQFTPWTRLWFVSSIQSSFR